MQKRYQIAIIIIIISLTTMLLINVQKKHEYETYLKQENENSISSILSVMQSNNEILKKYEESREITYAEFSRVGSSYLHAASALVDLQRQLTYFVSQEKDTNQNFNTMIRYFDGVSLFISMDVFQGIGNYYPHMYNDDLYGLNNDEKLVLDYMFELNQNFLAVISEKGFIDDPPNNKEYYIDVDSNNGLGELIDLIDGLADESKDYLGELISHDNSKVVEDFLFEVNYDY